MPIRPKAQARGEVNSVSAGKRLREELSGHHLEAPERRTSHAHAQRPQRPALTILRSLLIEPAAVKTQEIVEAFRLGVEGVMQEGGVGGGQRSARCSGSSPNSPSSTARMKARALSSVQ